MEIQYIKTIYIEGLAAKIKRIRKEAKLKVTELSKAANMTRAYWYAIEGGVITRIPETTLRNIEEALQVDLGVKMLCCDTASSTISDSTHIHQENKGESEVSD
ncbi:helix-turn-helix transcriptional regulator [Moorena sp. SIO3B2]|uniref:helix-turn-helix domain-containing protein n=1 Tax=Moorena sp. SIO3B2 TaxID=2607827 RepID=UPI0013C67104|nr:helix-turn-helix transcriptional regulator [Moorena sp. SIO3B2]NEP31754.1 helix-turn-helix transcriptional regulator [Moorena sp. SIO3B2]NEP31779.1 helix-turn-helix transcriptional regulator [Moorena sp. SIO3B2]